MTSIAIDLRPVAGLAPYSRNARKHSDAAVARLVSIIEEMGWTGPILVDEDGIVAGHKRWQDFTGNAAVLVQTGQTFADVSSERDAA